MKKKIWVIIISSIIILCGALFLVFVLIDAIDKKNTHIYETSDELEYGQWNGHMEFEMDSANEKLYIFPESITEAEDAKYYYKSKVDSSSNDSAVIFAKIKYSEEDYRKEIENLSNIACEIQVDGKAVTNELDYNEEQFCFPAYISVYNSNNTYEYALLDESNTTIVYVYMHDFIPDVDQVADEYLPKAYNRKNLFDDSSWKNKNIYFARNKAGDYVSCESNGHTVIPMK